MQIWAPDPDKDGKPSVTLTFAAISFIGFFSACILQTLGKVETTSAFNELFITCVGLYYGRRMNLKVGGVQMSGGRETSNDATDEEAK